jgi:hypothetical protein
MGSRSRASFSFCERLESPVTMRDGRDLVLAEVVTLSSVRLSWCLLAMDVSPDQCWSSEIERGRELTR